MAVIRRHEELVRERDDTAKAVATQEEDRLVKITEDVSLRTSSFPLPRAMPALKLDQVFGQAQRLAEEAFPVRAGGHVVQQTINSRLKLRRSASAVARARPDGARRFSRKYGSDACALWSWKYRAGQPPPRARPL
jgi:hypothetical protein